MAASFKRRSYSTATDERSDIVEHFDLVQSRIEDLIKHAKGLITMLKKRLTLDKEHMKAVQKLAHSVLEDSQMKHIKFQGQLEDHWGSVCASLQAEATHLSNSLTSLEQRSLLPLQTSLVGDLEKKFRHVVHEGKRDVKDFHGARAALYKAKEKYHGSTGEWQVSLIAIYKEFGDAWSPIPGHKLYEKEQQSARKMADARSEYEVTVSHVNSIQHDTFVSHLPSVLDTMHSLAEKMLSILNNSLLGLMDMQSVIFSGASGEKPTDDTFVATDYCRNFVFSAVTHRDIPPPTPYEFDEFTYSDEALMIQSRKVQYECMSKLSPTELMSRGQQFFAAGDRRTNSTSPSSPTFLAASLGVNPLLVELCVEYLQQPLALREEGMFRVSGDSSAIKSLHSDFISGKATPEFLRKAIMGQHDPNNISGLLKLHIRENPLLGNESTDILQSALVGPVMVLDSTLLDTLLSELKSSELQLLTKVIGLLGELVQEPWKDDNKMTPRTLGIACGLSIFPQLEPGKAANLLEYLVKHCDELQRSHSVL